MGSSYFFDIISYQGPTGLAKFFLRKNQMSSETGGYTIRDKFLKYYTPDTMDIWTKSLKKGKS